MKKIVGKKKSIIFGANFFFLFRYDFVVAKKIFWDRFDDVVVLANEGQRFIRKLPRSLLLIHLVLML